MKIILYLITLTISFGFYSCESTTSTIQNPLTYSKEQPFFKIEPYVSYNNIVNRIDYGIIKQHDQIGDSSYIRATFYDKRKFRDAGVFYFDEIKIIKSKADDIFNIVQFIENFIDFGNAYYLELDNHLFKDSISIQTTGQEFPSYNQSIRLLDSSLIIENVNSLNKISKGLNLKLLSNDIGYDNARIRIYNNSKEYVFYANFETVLNLDSELFNNIPIGKYKFECLKGHYLLDSASNGETVIINIYSSYTFDTIIKD
ncbi:MAG: hypothetical protein WC121_02135 [Candidatus Kapaibacterium sp.]